MGEGGRGREGDEEKGREEEEEEEEEEDDGEDNLARLCGGSSSNPTLAELHATQPPSSDLCECLSAPTSLSRSAVQTTLTSANAAASLTEANLRKIGLE